MTEVWKAIEGTSGMFEVSNTGRVRSLLRPNMTMLKMQYDSKGYQRVRVTLNRRKITFKVHREVARAFIPNPYNKPQVNHIDGNKDNNAVDNLEWVTNKENIRHAIDTGLFDSVIAGAQRSNESRERAIDAIDPCTGKRFEFKSISEAEKHFNSRHISDVLKGKRKHVQGWTFEYADVVTGGDSNDHADHTAKRKASEVLTG